MGDGNKSAFVFGDLIFFCRKSGKHIRRKRNVRAADREASNTHSHLDGSVA